MESVCTYVSGPGVCGASFSDILENSDIGIIQTHVRFVGVTVSLDHTCASIFFGGWLAVQLKIAWWLVNENSSNKGPAAADQWYHPMIPIRLELLRKRLKAIATFVELE